MIDPCLVLALLALGLIGGGLKLYLKYRELKQAIDFYREQYQACFSEYQKVRDALGMKHINNALKEFESGRLKVGETVDYG